MQGNDGKPNLGSMNSDFSVESLSQNGLWMKKHHQYEREKRAEILDNLLRLRPTREELVKMHILIERMCDKAEEANPEAIYLRQDLRNLLCEHLKNRPSLNHLVENHIIKPVSLSCGVDNDATNLRHEIPHNVPHPGLDHHNNPVSIPPVAGHDAPTTFDPANPRILVGNTGDSQGLFLIPGTDQVFQRIGNNLIPCGKLVLVENKAHNDPNRTVANKEPLVQMKSYFNQPKQKTYNFHEFSPESPSHRVGTSENSHNYLNHGPSGHSANSQSHSSGPTHFLRYRGNRNSSSGSHKNFIIPESHSHDQHGSMQNANAFPNGSQPKDVTTSSKTLTQLKLQGLIDEQAKSLEKQIMLERYMKSFKASKSPLVNSGISATSKYSGNTLIDGHLVRMMKLRFDQSQQNHIDCITNGSTPSSSIPSDMNEQTQLQPGSQDNVKRNSYDYQLSSLPDLSTFSQDDSGILNEYSKNDDHLLNSDHSNFIDPFSSVLEAIDGLSSGKSLANDDINEDSRSVTYGSYINLENSFSNPPSYYHQHHQSRTCFGCGSILASEKCSICGSHTTHNSGFSNTSTSLFSDTSEFTSPCSSFDLDFLIDPFIPFPSVSEKVALYEWISSSDDKIQIRRRDPFTS